MSIVQRGARVALVLGLAAGVPVAFAGSALAESTPAPSASGAQPPAADVAVTADYSTEYGEEVVGDAIIMHEGELTPADAQVTRRIDWGDGSAIEVETTAPAHGWSHVYRKAGVFHLAVKLQSGTDSGVGTFPYGNTMTIYASTPSWALSGKARLVPDHVGVNQTVTLDEYDTVGDGTSPAPINRTVNWGDGTPSVDYDMFQTPMKHQYAKPGTYRVRVKYTVLQWHLVVPFPDGDTVVVHGKPGSGGGSSGGSGGGLPVTGPGAAAIGGLGLGILLAGTVAVVTLRRRRVRFVR